MNGSDALNAVATVSRLRLLICVASQGTVHKSYKRVTDLSVLLSKHVTKAFREENGLPTLLKASKELWADPDWRPTGFGYAMPPATMPCS